jgi:hypothetical protein
VGHNPPSFSRMDRATNRANQKKHQRQLNCSRISTILLAQAYNRIRNRAVRRNVLELVAGLAETH